MTTIPTGSNLPPLSLNDLGRFYGTDKVSGWGHDYLRWYEPILTPLRDVAGAVLEIGVGAGASLKTWRAFFPNARIVGLDIDQGRFNREAERITIVIGDQSSASDLNSCLQVIGDVPLIVVNDDGSHVPEHQLFTFKHLFPYLAPSGVYLLEDILTPEVGTFFGQLAYRCLSSNWSTDDPWIFEYGPRIDGVAFYPNAVVVWTKPTSLT